MSRSPEFQAKTQLRSDDQPLEEQYSQLLKSQRSKEKIHRRVLSFVKRSIGLWTLVVLVLIWAFIASLHAIQSFFLPSPLAVFDALRSYAAHGMGSDLQISGEEFGIGYVIGVSAGILLGLIMGTFSLVREAFHPLVSFSYSVPTIALAPLLLIWCGIGIWSKVALVALGAFFPVLVNTTAAIQSAETLLTEMADCFGASRRKILSSISIPGSLPYILSGMRLAVGHGIIGVFVGELLSANHGVGYFISNSGNLFETSNVFAGLFILGVFGIGLTTFIRYVEGHFDVWRSS